MSVNDLRFAVRIFLQAFSHQLKLKVEISFIFEAFATEFTVHFTTEPFYCFSDKILQMI